MEKPRDYQIHLVDSNDKEASSRLLNPSRYHMIFVTAGSLRPLRLSQKKGQ